MNENQIKISKFRKFEIALKLHKYRNIELHKFMDAKRIHEFMQLWLTTFVQPKIPEKNPIDVYT